MYSNPLPTAATPLAPPVQPLRYRLPRLTSLVLTIGMLAGLAACGASNAPPAGPPGGMPPAEVGVVTVTPGDLGAAMEGYLFGIPAIAFSQIERGWTHLDAAGAKAREIVLQLAQQQMIGARPWLLNVNIPNLPLEQIKPLKVCRLGRRHAAEPVITQVNPRGETMYWIGAAGPALDEAEGTDFHATEHGHVVVTPLKVDLTDHDNLGKWAQTAAELGASLRTPE